MVCLDSVSLPNEALLGSLKSRLGLGDGRKEIADVLVDWYDWRNAQGRSIEDNREISNTIWLAIFAVS
jgi:hypothetical protein